MILKQIPLQLMQAVSHSVNRVVNSFSRTKAPSMNPAEFMVRPTYRVPRNPVVLCHGLYGFDKLGFESMPYLQLHYWQGISQVLEKIGVKLSIAKVDRTGSIHTRGQQLREFVANKVPNQKVNLVAHSMGGLDSRYLITHIRPTEFQVSSLTTISTPHRGSGFMDWCRDNLRVGLGEQTLEDRIPNDSARQNWFEGFMKMLDTPAYSHLTSDYLQKKFNPTTPDDPNVKYYSYSAYLDQMHYMSILHLPWMIINAKDGKNDGLVSLNSAKWGHHVGTVRANHFDLVARFRWVAMVGQWIGLKGYRDPLLEPCNTRFFLPNEENEFDRIEFYISVMNHLYEQGH